MKPNPKRAAQALAMIACILSLSPSPRASATPADDGALSAAICPIVYPVDPAPSDRGYRYLFYGNGFFINEQGYLVTASHVLGQLRGGQPYVLLRPSAGPPRFLPATLVALDRDHDVAVLRATPNPFVGAYKVGFLTLAVETLARGRAALAASIYPSRNLDAHTLDDPVDGRSPGELFDFQFSRLDKGPNETELFLFNHAVRRGESGAPVVSGSSQELIGFVEGQWLRSSLVPFASASPTDAQGVGAAVPVHYVIALLQQKGIPWHAAPRGSSTPENSEDQTKGFSPPFPFSLVASPFPTQSLFGSEVVLDALIDDRGRLADTRVVSGAAPFLENVMATVRTWNFIPARLDGQAVAARIGITFEFSQSYEPLRARSSNEYEEPMRDAADRGALPVLTVAPQFPAASTTDASVILYGAVGPQGQLASVQVLRDSDPLTPAALAAVHQWHFVPGRRAGKAAGSAAIVVFVYRYTGSSHSLPEIK